MYNHVNHMHIITTVFVPYHKELDVYRMYTYICPVTVQLISLYIYVYIIRRFHLVLLVYILHLMDFTRF